MVNHRRSSNTSIESSQTESTKNNDPKTSPEKQESEKRLESPKEPKTVRKRSPKNDKKSNSTEKSERLSENGKDNKKITETTTNIAKEKEDLNVSNTSSSSSTSQKSNKTSTGGEKLICSLSLDRLSGILQTLTKSKKNANDSQPPESQNGIKILCLYCERTFSSHKLYAKHSERAHRLVEGRRISGRTNPTTNEDGGVAANDAAQAFSGCSFCSSNKFTNMVVEDLDLLFAHLVDVHSDKYFACKECVVRFANEDCQLSHMKVVHNKEPVVAISAATSATAPKKLSLPLTKPLSIVVDFQEEIMARAAAIKKANNDNEVRLTRNAAKINHAERSNELLSAKEQMLIRLGIAHHRSPRTRKGAKNRRGANTDSSRTNRSGRSSVVNFGTTEPSDFVIVKSKNEVLNCTFDEEFYEMVSNNVRTNLSCHLDGKINGNPTEPSPLSPVTVCPTVRSTVVHSSLENESEIHEATTLSTTTAFPTLLTADQYGANVVTSNKHRKPVTKNSWKWKWDCVKKYKYVNEGGKIVKKIKQPISGQRDLSKLDMWTQLVMRKKHEDLKELEPSTSSKSSSGSTNRTHKIDKHQQDSQVQISNSVRQEKRRIVEQLNQILDARSLPQINVEQDEQRVIKPDPDEDDYQKSPVKVTGGSKEAAESELFQVLKLFPSTKSTQNRVLLSGEWARPRCYICFCCGTKFESFKHLDDHKFGRHPHVSCTHYEIVGRELIEKRFYSHFYLPGKALETNRLLNSKELPTPDSPDSPLEVIKDIKEPISVEDSMDSVTSATNSSLTNETDANTKASKSSNISSSSSSSIQNPPSSPLKSKCTKCDKETNSLLELHRHLLDCSGDYAWLQVKKRLKYRRLLGKKRRTSRNIATIRRPKSNSKTEDDEKDGGSPKPKPPPTPKVRPSDAESIQRMLANLPAKRICRQILQLNNQTIRRKIQQKPLQIPIKTKTDNQLQSSKQVKKDEPVESKDMNRKSKVNEEDNFTGSITLRKSLRSSASSSTASSPVSKETSPAKSEGSSSKDGLIKKMQSKAKNAIKTIATSIMNPKKNNKKKSVKAKEAVDDNSNEDSRSEKSFKETTPVKESLPIEKTPEKQTQVTEKILEQIEAPGLADKSSKDDKAPSSSQVSIEEAPTNNESQSPKPVEPEQNLPKIEVSPEKQTNSEIITSDNQDKNVINEKEVIEKSADTETVKTAETNNNPPEPVVEKKVTNSRSKGSKKSNAKPIETPIQPKEKGPISNLDKIIEEVASNQEKYDNKASEPEYVDHLESNHPRIDGLNTGAVSIDSGNRRRNRKNAAPRNICKIVQLDEDEAEPPILQQTTPLQLSINKSIVQTYVEQLEPTTSSNTGALDLVKRTQPLLENTSRKLPSSLEAALSTRTELTIAIHTPTGHLPDPFTPNSGSSMNLCDSSTPLSSPALYNSTESLLKTPPNKRKQKKLTDCIAMLTDKLHDKAVSPTVNSMYSPRKDLILDNMYEEAIDLSAKSRHVEENTITLTSDGVLDLSKKPAIRHSVESIISPSKRSISPTNYSKTASHEPYPSSSKFPSLSPYTPKNMNPVSVDITPNISLTISNPKPVNVPVKPPPIPENIPMQYTTPTKNMMQHHSDKNLLTEVGPSPLELSMLEQQSMIPPHLELTPNILSMIGLGLPLYPPPSLYPPLADFGIPQVTATFRSELSKPTPPKRNNRRQRPSRSSIESDTANDNNNKSRNNLSTTGSEANKTSTSRPIASIDTILDSIEAVIKQSAMEAEQTESAAEKVKTTQPSALSIFTKSVEEDVISVTKQASSLKDSISKSDEPLKSVTDQSDSAKDSKVHKDISNESAIPSVISEKNSQKDVTTIFEANDENCRAEMSSEPVLKTTEASKVKSVSVPAPTPLSDDTPTDFEALIDEGRPKEIILPIPEPSKLQEEESAPEKILDSAKVTKKGGKKNNNKKITSDDEPATSNLLNKVPDQNEKSVEQVKSTPKRSTKSTKKTKNDATDAEVGNSKIDANENEKASDKSLENSKADNEQNEAKSSPTKKVANSPKKTIEPDQRATNKAANRSKAKVTIDENINIKDHEDDEPKDTAETTQAASIGYLRRKSIRLLGLSPELGSFDNEPLELPPTQRKQTQSKSNETVPISKVTDSMEEQKSEELETNKKSTRSSPRKSAIKFDDTIKTSKQDTNATSDDEPLINTIRTKASKKMLPEQLQSLAADLNASASDTNESNKSSKKSDNKNESLEKVELKKSAASKSRKEFSDVILPLKRSTRSLGVILDSDLLDITKKKDEKQDAGNSQPTKAKNISKNKPTEKHETNNDNSVKEHERPKSRSAQKVKNEGKEAQKKPSTKTAESTITEKLPNKPVSRRKAHVMSEDSDASQTESEKLNLDVKRVSVRRSPRDLLKIPATSTPSTTSSADEQKSLPKDGKTQPKKSAKQSLDNEIAEKMLEGDKKGQESDASATTLDAQSVLNKPKKPRRNKELAAIIADQLLESFKEVDQSRKNELQVLHDLTCNTDENTDELLVSAIRTTPIPRRKAATKAKDALDSESESRLTSPARSLKSPELLRRSLVASPAMSEPTDALKAYKKIEPPKPELKSKSIEKKEEVTPAQNSSKTSQVPATPKKRKVDAEIDISSQNQEDKPFEESKDLNQQTKINVEKSKRNLKENLAENIDTGSKLPQSENKSVKRKQPSNKFEESSEDTELTPTPSTRNKKNNDAKNAGNSSSSSVLQAKEPLKKKKAIATSTTAPPPPPMIDDEEISFRRTTRKAFAQELEFLKQMKLQNDPAPLETPKNKQADIQTSLAPVQKQKLAEVKLQSEKAPLTSSDQPKEKPDESQPSVVDVEVERSLVKLDKTKKATERNAILSDLFDHLKDDPRSKESVEVSKPEVAKKDKNKSSKDKRKEEKNPFLQAPPENNLAVNIFSKGLDLPIPPNNPLTTALVSPTGLSRGIFLRPSALDKVLDSKNDGDNKPTEERTLDNKNLPDIIQSTSMPRKIIPSDATVTAPRRRSSKRLSADRRSSLKQLENFQDDLNFNDDELDESSEQINAIVNKLINRADETDTDEDFHVDDAKLDEFKRKLDKKGTEKEKEKPQTGKPQNETIENSSGDEENSNANMVDMDIDDDVSVITDYTICQNEADGKIGSRIPKKRKIRRTVFSKKRPRVQSKESAPNEEFNCDLCKKVFRKQEGLTKHKMTLSHIAKLSEIEYENSQKQQKSLVPVGTPVMDQVQSSLNQVQQDLNDFGQPESPIVSKPNTPDILLPDISPRHSVERQDDGSIHSLSNSGIEPISSPEHMEPTCGDQENLLERKAADNSRMALNSEERLFYEVCSMLKGSKADAARSGSTPNKNLPGVNSSKLTNLTMFQQSLGCSAKSPMAESRSSPKAAYPKIDLNQFSDISSDSDLLSFGGRVTKQTGMSARLTEFLNLHQKMFNNENRQELEKDHGMQARLDRLSDVNDSERSFVDDSDNEPLISKPTGQAKVRRRVFSPLSEKGPPTPSPVADARDIGNATYASSLHSTASSHESHVSNMSRIKTKAAMKGFDNFKVSIPTTGLDMPTALSKKDKSVNRVDLDGLAEDWPKEETVSKNDTSSVRRSRNRQPKPKSPTSKQSPPTKKETKSTRQSKNKNVDLDLLSKSSTDIYDFDDSQEFKEELPLDGYRSKPKVTPTKSNENTDSSNSKKQQEPTDEDAIIVVNDDSQQSSTSYSDRDDFIFGDNSPASSSSSSSSDSEVETKSPIRRASPKKPADPPDSQKKSLIMGKIFRKRDNSKSKPESTSETTAPPPKAKTKIDRDKLFDILKGENQRKRERERQQAQKSANMSNDESEDAEKSERKSRKPREIATIEAEWGMSMQQIEELIGIGSRKSKRRCASNRSKNFVETWSSDEYEEFHTTKDIIALIEDAERKAQRKVRSNSNNKRVVKEPQETQSVYSSKVNSDNEKHDASKAEDSDSESDALSSKTQSQAKASTTKKKSATEKSASRKTNKKKNTSKKPKNIAYDSDSDYEHHLKKSAVTKVTANPPASIKQRRRTTIALKEREKPDKSEEAEVKDATSPEKLPPQPVSRPKLPKKSREAEDTLGRRKRNASDQLYYWSSSSDENFGKISDQDSNAESDDSGETKFQQHGWIVGDSHKKLVSLLARAKAKKIEDSGVKEGGAKKK